MLPEKVMFERVENEAVLLGFRFIASADPLGKRKEQLMGSLTISFWREKMWGLLWEWPDSGL